MGGQPFPVTDAVDRLPLVLILLATLYATVDDVDGGTKAITDAGRNLALGGHPGSVDDVQHGGFGGLRRQEEPDGGGEVEPGVGHQAGVVQQHGGVAVKHRLGEGAVVEVIGELFRTTAKVALPRATGPFPVLPVILATAGGIAELPLGPAHFAHMHQRLLPLLEPQRVVGDILPGDVAARLLGKVGEGGDDGFFADGVRIAPVRVVAAEGGELADRPQEALIGIFRGRHLGQKVPVRFGKYPLDPFDVVRVVGSSRHNRLHQDVGAGGQCL